MDVDGSADSAPESGLVDSGSAAAAAESFVMPLVMNAGAGPVPGALGRNGENPRLAVG